MQRLLIVAGAALLLAGLLWPWASKLGLGRLPGDFVIRREGFTFYLPLATCLVVSALLSVVVWLLRR
jgi:hypothetical protein